jgi:hypothetical protein
MFLKTQYETANGLVPRLINIMQVATIGECHGKRKDEGFKSVLWMAGSGYAMYSRLSPDEIAEEFDLDIVDGTVTDSEE